MDGPQDAARPATVDCVQCTTCGHDNPDGANFCSSCGTVLPGRADTTVSFVPVEPVPDSGEYEMVVGSMDTPGSGGALIVRRGPDAGQRFELAGEVTRVGRHPESEIFLDDITVSRRHAELCRKPEGFVVRDVGSLNGTYVNRERIDEAILDSGDEVQIGKFKLIFVAESAG